MKKGKVLSMVLACTFLLSCITGCTKDNGDSKPSSTGATPPTTSNGTDTSSMVNGVDISKEVNLVGYLVGDAAPAAMQKVTDALNEKFKKDINTTIELRHIANADLTSKYPLVLATGEDVDFVYAANWMQYSDLSAKGAFKALTMEDFEVRMPRQYEQLKDTNAFNEIKVNGEMYMIPSSFASDGVPVIVIREDLRKKYNVPEVNSIEDLEPYLAAIKANEPTMIPINCNGAYDVTVISNPFGASLNKSGVFLQDFFQATGTGSHICWELNDKEHKVLTLDDEDYVNRLKASYSIAKTWADKGYINKDYFSNKVSSRDSFAQGKSAVGMGNAINIQASIDAATGNGYECKVILALDKNNHFPQTSHSHGIAIAAGSKNSDRIMLAMDLLMQEKDYIMTAYYGIEGENYVITPDGKVGLPEGVTAETNTYPPDAAGVWFTNQSLFPPMESWTDDFVALKQKVRSECLQKHDMAGFNADTTKIKTELANIGNVMIQYGQPLKMGMVDNVDTAFDEMKAKLKAAGYDKVVEEIKTQVEEYKKSLS